MGKTEIVERLRRIRAEIALNGLVPFKWISAGHLAKVVELSPTECGSTLLSLFNRGLVDSKWEIEHINRRYVRHRIYRLNRAGRKYIRELDGGQG